MTAAIFGKTSRLGSTLSTLLERRDQYTCLSRTDADFRDLHALKRCCVNSRWDAAIIATALTDVDYCEEHPEEALLVNAVAPATIAHELARMGTRVIFLSTDFVFAGDSRMPYLESDSRGPASVYAKSKALAEDAVLAASPDNVVVRSSWLFGGGKPSLPDIMIRRAFQQPTLQVVADRWSSPTYVLDLAVAVQELLHLPEASGIIHFCNMGVCSPLDYVSSAIAHARLNGLPIVTRSIEPLLNRETLVLKAPRPDYSALDTNRFTSLTGRTPRNWSDALGEYVFHIASTMPSLRVAA